MNHSATPAAASGDIQAGNVAGNTYDKYASNNPIERRMMDGFFAALDELLDGTQPSLIVEVGAGEGHITERLVERFPDATVVGLDLPDSELAAEWATLEVPMFFGDVTRLPFADHSVDLIVGLEVLEHVPSPELALAEVARVCSGTTVLSVPRRTDLADRQHRTWEVSPAAGQHARPREPLVGAIFRALGRPAIHASNGRHVHFRGRWCGRRRVSWRSRSGCRSTTTRCTASMICLITS